MQTKTKEVAKAIETYLRDHPTKTISPSTFTWACKARNNITAAITWLKRNKIIEIAYISCAGTPCYRLHELYWLREKSSVNPEPTEAT